MSNKLDKTLTEINHRFSIFPSEDAIQTLTAFAFLSLVIGGLVSFTGNEWLQDHLFLFVIPLAALVMLVGTLVSIVLFCIIIRAIIWLLRKRFLNN